MSDFNFTTKLNSSELISEIPNEEPDAAEISWGVNLDVRDWGIKSIDPSIEKVTVFSVDKKGNVIERSYLPDSIKISNDSKTYPIFITKIVYSETEVTVIF